MTHPHPPEVEEMMSSRDPMDWCVLGDWFEDKAAPGEGWNAQRAEFWRRKGRFTHELLAAALLPAGRLRWFKTDRVGGHLRRTARVIDVTFPARGFRLHRKGCRFVWDYALRMWPAEQVPTVRGVCETAHPAEWARFDAKMESIVGWVLEFERQRDAT